MKLLTPISLTLILICFSNLLLSQVIHSLETRNVNQTESVPVIKYDSQNNLIMGLDRTTVLGGTGSSFPSNVWIEKWDQHGNLQWSLASNITNSQFDSQFIDIAVDHQDNIYMAGIYKAPDFTLGGKTIHGFSNNGIDFFIAKVSSTGNVIWLKGVDTTQSHASRRSLNSISTTPDGSLLIVGQQMRDFHFNGTTFKGDSTVPFINNSATPVTFYAKMNTDGGILWHHRVLNRHSGQWNGGNSLNEMYQSEDGIIYATFWADSSLVFTNDTITTPQPGLWADGEGILKMNAEGELIDWKFLISPGYWIKKMRLDNCGKPVFMGYYKNSMTIDSLQINARAKFDVFVAKLDTSLNPLWLKSHGSDQGHLGTGLAINNRNEVFITYDFWGTLSYNNQNFTPSAVETAVVKLDSSGNYVWHNHTDGTGATIQARDLAIAPNNKLTLVAYYNGTKSIDNHSVTNGPTLDLMLATFNDTTHPGVTAGCQTVSNVGAYEHKVGAKVKVYPNPATNRLQVSIPDAVIDEVQQLTIYDLQQKMVLTTKVKGVETGVDVSSLSPGVYILDAGQGLRVKFIKH